MSPWGSCFHSITVSSLLSGYIRRPYLAVAEFIVMENEKTISSTKTEKEYVCDAEQGKVSRIETTRHYEMQEISDEKAKLLGDVSSGARPKTSITETRVGMGSKSSASSSPDPNKNTEAACKAAESARKAVFSCRRVLEYATIAACDGKKRLATALKYAEKVHPSQVPHYLAVVNKYRTVLDFLSESVRGAENGREKAEIAADNAEKAGKKLSEGARKLNIKDAELLATWATTTAEEKRIEAYKAAYVVLKATKKFWQEAYDAINLEESFKKSIQRTNITRITCNVVLIAALLLGCIVITINYHLKKNYSYYLVFFIGCALILGSVLTGIVRIVGYCTDEGNFVEKMKIRRNLKGAEDRLRAFDDYFAKNKITPVPSDSSGDEITDSHVTEETPLNEK